jgi:hypothetical protein
MPANVALPANLEATCPTGDDVAKMQIDRFLEEVYKLAKLDDLDGATDRIFDFIDRLLCDSLFPVCDEVLRRVDVEKLSTSLMRSFLSITDAAKHKLPSRPAFYQKIEQRMVCLKGLAATCKIIGNLA